MNTHAEQMEAYRAERVAWWTNEARECERLEMYRLAYQCLVNAEQWRRGGPLAEMLEKVA